MSNKALKELELSERDLILGRFERNGFVNIMESDHEQGLVDDQNPQFAMLYKYEKGKNFFVFINIKRSVPFREISDVSTQMLVVEKRKQPKMVARNKFFDASDSIGNMVHLEFSDFDEPIEVMNQIHQRLR